MSFYRSVFTEKNKINYVILKVSISFLELHLLESNRSWLLNLIYFLLFWDLGIGRCSCLKVILMVLSLDGRFCAGSSGFCSCSDRKYIKTCWKLQLFSMILMKTDRVYSEKLNRFSIFSIRNVLIWKNTAESFCHGCGSLQQTPAYLSAFWLCLQAGGAGSGEEVWAAEQRAPRHDGYRRSVTSSGERSHEIS